MKAFDLIYGAFDFIVTPEGRYVFLEVNPSGQYMWVECATGLEITTALADALSEPCRI
jgi:D-alanine-D-alanine ligase-like ATP-grasp enzyme